MAAGKNQQREPDCLCQRWFKKTGRGKLLSPCTRKIRCFKGIKLSRNKGHQNALLAGLMTVKEHCDMAISMDADLQDDIDAIDGMLEKYAERLRHCLWS